MMAKDDLPISGRKRRSQRDYNLGFKLAVVAQVEKGEMTYIQAQHHYGIQGRSTVLVWLRKHGSLDWQDPTKHTMSNGSKEETPEQKIKRLERELSDERLKNQVLDKVLEVIDQTMGTSFRKKCWPGQSSTSKKRKG
jgi:transposase